MGALLSREATHCLIDRATGERIKETTPLSKTLRTTLLYDTPLGRLLLRLPLTWWLLTLEHHRISAFANSARSRRAVLPMVRSYRIDVADAARPVDEYATLQDFFTRELKPGARPVAAPRDAAVAVQPADSRVAVFPSVGEATRLWVKGRGFSVPALLGPGFDADEWRDCAIVISRLSPADCHRLHAPVAGRVASVARRGDKFMASLWVAVHSSLDVMVENERLVMAFDSDALGPVVMVMIGASDVGSVQPLVKAGARVSKGDEVGVFAMGGSLVATVFRRGAVAFDADLLRHSARGCETRCMMGQSLGRATGAPAPAGQ